MKRVEKAKLISQLETRNNARWKGVNKVTTEAQKQARKNYKSKGKRITVDFYQTELKLFDWVNQQPAKQTYIKDLIRKDMLQETPETPV